MTFYNRRADLGLIREMYEFKCVGHLDQGEELRCYGCGLFTKKPGTASYVWARTAQFGPAVMELCDLCHASVGGAAEP